jgi:hypothetical protein
VVIGCRQNEIHESLAIELVKVGAVTQKYCVTCRVDENRAFCILPCSGICFWVDGTVIWFIKGSTCCENSNKTLDSPV